LIAFLTLSIAEAKAPSTQITTEITDLNKSTNSVLVAILQVPAVVIKKPVVITGNCEQYRLLVAQYDWNVDIAMAIMNAESECSTTVVNDNPATKDYSIGLFQINLFGNNAKSRPSEEALKDPATNIAFAYKLYKSSGFQSQWGVCRKKVNCG